MTITPERVRAWLRSFSIEGQPLMPVFVNQTEFSKNFYDLSRAYLDAVEKVEELEAELVKDFLHRATENIASIARGWAAANPEAAKKYLKAKAEDE